MRSRRSRSMTRTACSRTLTAGACRCSRPTVGATRGVIARPAIIASCSGVTPITSSGSSAANRGSSPAWRAVIRPAVAIRSAKDAAMSLNARYCSSRAKSRSRASISARSSSSCGASWGSSRADLMSSRVAATSRNSEAWLRSQSVSDAWWARMCAMNSSVTLARAISVMSSLCLEMSPSSRSNGPGEDVEVHLERRAAAAPGDHPSRGELDAGRGQLGRVGLGHGAQAAPPRAMSSRASCR